MTDRRRRGRPPRALGPSDHRFELRLTDAERADLEQIAAENQTSMANLAREAINEFVADYRERRIFVR